jgi:hypothetical protein
MSSFPNSLPSIVSSSLGSMGDKNGASSDQINLNMPTTEQINRALAESGERDRLKAVLKAKLWESGWHEQLKAECMAELKKKGVDKVGPHELVSLLGPRAKCIIIMC